jgi:pilus assembly protein Flp/PilA
MDEAGVTAIEYALFAALIAVAIVGSVTLLGNSVRTRYVTNATEIKNAF